jgi:hypothetical protein
MSRNIFNNDEALLTKTTGKKNFIKISFIVHYLRYITSCYRMNVGSKELTTQTNYQL